MKLRKKSVLIGRSPVSNPQSFNHMSSFLTYMLIFLRTEFRARTQGSFSRGKTRILYGAYACFIFRLLVHVLNTAAINRCFKLYTHSQKMDIVVSTIKYENKMPFYFR